VLSGLTLGIFTYLVGSIFDTNLYSLPLAVLFWLMAGLAVGTIRIIDVEAKS
jgi:ABC-type transport system involved in multi-copper enzyme maturation permease subunit